MEADLRAADRDRPQPAPAPPARRALRRALRRLAALPGRAGGEVLPPGLRARAARAHADRRPGRERGLGLVPRRRPRPGGDRRAASTTSARSRPTARTRPRSTSPTTASCSARSRSATTWCAAQIEQIDGFPWDLARALLHILLSHHGTLENGSPVVPATREATSSTRSTTSAASSAASTGSEGPARRRDLVGLRPRARGAAYFAGLPRRRRGDGNGSSRDAARRRRVEPASRALSCTHPCSRTRSGKPRRRAIHEGDAARPSRLTSSSAARSCSSPTRGATPWRPILARRDQGVRGLPLRGPARGRRRPRP